MPDSRLLLIDGMAVIYRAFYAIKQLSTADGRPTNAVFGFVKMLRQMSETWKPTHWCVVFDGGLPDERVELLPEYKAQRSPMPDALREQLDPCVAYLRKAGIQDVKLDGEEADDLLASMAIDGEAQGMNVFIATSDKDLFQLIGPKIQMVTLSAGKKLLLGENEVKEKTGVLPGQIVDWLALTGDAVDNIPGVPGVGPKTAARLLNQYETVEGLYYHWQDLPTGKVKESLDRHKADVERNQKMIRLRTHLPSPVALDLLRCKDGDTGDLLRFFEELEFESLANELRQGDLF